MDSKKMTRKEALEQIGALLARVPEDKVTDVANHLTGIINGICIASELQRAKGVA